MTPLNPPIVLRPQVTSSGFTVLSTVDNPAEKLVTALVLLSESPVIQRRIVVWSGEAYDTAGQWTDASLNAAIKALLES